MSGSEMRSFSFDGNSLEQIYGWMQQGHGVDGIRPAIDALSGLSRDLEKSMDSLRDALIRIGAWEGTAGDGAMDAHRQGDEWVVATTPQVTGSAESTDGVATGYVATKARMPSPEEAELTTGERSLLGSVPIIGPLLDRQKADEKRDQVTNEARQRMRDWQDDAQSSVGAVQPLPAVPTPAVDVAPPRPVGTATIPGPVQTEQAGVQAAAPPLPPQAGGPPSTGGPVPVVSGSGPGVPQPAPSSGPRFGAAPPLPPAAPPVTQVPAPAAPRGGVGVPLLPLPLTGSTGGDEAGRRRAYGPGAFNAEEIARSRGGAGAGPGRPGVLGAPPDEGRPGAAGKGAVPAGEEATTRRAAAGASGAAGRGAAGSLMQPAVGGTRGEEDGEHTDKYAEKSDEYFVGEPHRVAPPVIGG